MAATPPTRNATILARLDALGKYEFHRPSIFWRWAGMPSEVEWESPAGFGSDLADISVALWFHSGKTAADGELGGLLDAIEEFRAHLAEHVASLRQHLVDCFRECYEDQLEEFDRQRLMDESGQISDAAILGDVQSIHIRFDVSGKRLVRTAWIAIGWDEEHGIDVEWDGDGRIIRSWRESRDHEN